MLSALRPAKGLQGRRLGGLQPRSGALSQRQRRGQRAVALAATIVEQGEQAYGKHMVKEGEDPVPDTLKNAFLRIQNGADVRGVVLDGVQGEAVNLTLLTVFFIARGYATWLSRKLEMPTASLRVSVGTDSRISALAMRCSFEAGIASKGGSIANCGLATTPAMFFSCVATGHMYDGGVMVTASHLPWNRNGLKFFTKHGGLDKMDIRWILEEAATDCFRTGLEVGNALFDPAYVIDAARSVPPSAVVQSNFMEAYAASLRSAIIQGVEHPESPEKPLAGLKILVDAGNGAGGFFAGEVLAKLGADTAGSQFLDPDGSFPNHVPNPEDAAAMAATIDAVNANDADLGIVFDTDVDRSGVVDKNGRAINKNKLIALMAAITLRDVPESTIVTDSVTSSGLTAFIEAHGGKHFRYKRGYKNVINKGVELNKEGVECELMMETSGHGALRANRFLDDGAYMSVKIIIEAARRRWQGRPDIGQILDELEEPSEDAEVRLKIEAADFKPIADAIIESFRGWIDDGAGPQWRLDSPNHEGVRVQVWDEAGEVQTGWALLRASLHDPLIVINAESDNKGGVKKIFQKIRKFLSQTQVDTCDSKSGKCSEALDIAALNDYA